MNDINVHAVENSKVNDNAVVPLVITPGFQPALDEISGALAEVQVQLKAIEASDGKTQAKIAAKLQYCFAALHGVLNLLMSTEENRS